MEKHTNRNVKALAAEDESSDVSGLKWNYQFDTLVVSRGTNLDRNRTLTRNVYPVLSRPCTIPSD